MVWAAGVTGTVEVGLWQAESTRLLVLRKPTVLAGALRALVHGPAQSDRDMAHRDRSFSAALAFASRTRCSM
jgi:hypothetical protein